MTLSLLILQMICRDNFKYEVADTSRRNGVNVHDLLALEEPKVTTRE